MSIVFFPANLNLEDILEKNPPEFTYEVDDFKYIIGTLIRLKIQNKDNLESEYTSLSSSVLQTRIRKYNRYLEYLVKNGIFATDNHFIKGQKSRGYKLLKEFVVQGFRTEEITKRTLIRPRREERMANAVLNKRYAYLMKWFNKKLQIDRKGAINYLADLLNEEQNAGVVNADERYSQRILSVEALHNGIYYLSIDETGRRFHSNLTNLKSGLRNFVTYNGMQLCSVDVKNSQPFISAALFNPDFYKKENGGINLFSLSPEIFKAVSPYFSQISSILSNISSVITLVKSDITQCHSDIERYCTLSDKGLLYPYISEQYEQRTGIKLDISNPEQKSQLKKALFLVLYSDNRWIGVPDAEMKRLFAELFPAVYKIFTLFKKGEKSHLPILLQLIESEIVLNRVAKHISLTYPALPIFTIHDSIVTLSEHREMARMVLKDEFQQAIGLQPNLSYEVWQEPKENR